MNLPLWIREHPEALVLLTQAIADRPDHRMAQAHAWTEQRKPRWTGKAAARLRAYYDRLKDEAQCADDAEWYLSHGKHNGTRLAALIVQEGPDDLLTRLFAEEAVLDLTVKQISGDRWQVAA